MHTDLPVALAITSIALLAMTNTILSGPGETSLVAISAIAGLAGYQVAKNGKPKPGGTP